MKHEIWAENDPSQQQYGRVAQRKTAATVVLPVDVVKYSDPGLLDKERIVLSFCRYVEKDDSIVEYHYHPGPLHRYGEAAWEILGAMVKAGAVYVAVDVLARGKQKLGKNLVAGAGMAKDSANLAGYLQHAHAQLSDRRYHVEGYYATGENGEIELFILGKIRANDVRTH